MDSASAGVRPAMSEAVAHARRIASFAWARVSVIYAGHGAHGSRPGSARARVTRPGDDLGQVAVARQGTPEEACGQAICGVRGMSEDKATVARNAAPHNIDSLALYSVKGLPCAVEVCCTRCGMLALFSSASRDDLALSDLAIWGRYHVCLATALAHRTILPGLGRRDQRCSCCACGF
jgi:hypothetical protein